MIDLPSLSTLSERLHRVRHALGSVQHEVVSQKVGPDFYLAMRCVDCGRVEKAELDARWQGIEEGFVLIRPRVLVDVTWLPGSWERL